MTIPPPNLSSNALYLKSLQTEAEAAGRQCVVGGLIRDGIGRIFVQKRSPDRRLFPGCWDIAGGHVEAGETLYTALAREIEEETGWQLVQILSLVHTFDWETSNDGQLIKKREFDFLVEVSGDLTSPQLEADKFSEYRWVGMEDLAILKENRPEGDMVIFNLVRKGFSKVEDRHPE